MKFFTILIMSLCLTAWADELKLNFDGNTTSQGKLVPAKIQSIGAPLHYQKGIKGKAFVTQAKPKKLVRIILKKDEFPSQGSICFWACPLDWNYLDKKFHILFNAHFYSNEVNSSEFGKDKNAHSRILIYKYGNKNIAKSGLALPLFFYKNNKLNWALNYPGSKMTNWKANKWHFICLVWKKVKGKPYFEYFIDAERAGIISKDYDLKGTAVLTIGASWGDKGKTLIDNFSLKDQVLNKEQITEIYENTLEEYYSQEDN